VKILDTDVCIEILRGNRQVIARCRESLAEVATSWITAAELSFGAAKSRAPANNQNLVIEFLATLPIIGLNLPAAELFGQHKAGLPDARPCRGFCRGTKKG
jgi:tRNA(fMet)-specific endonuclease VapC